MAKYTDDVASWLRANYPDLGPTACQEKLGAEFSIKGIRAWAHRNGVKWVRTGKPRPNDQSALMKRLWEEGKIVPASQEENMLRGKKRSEMLASGAMQHPRGMLGKPQTEKCKTAARIRALELVAQGKSPLQRPRTKEQRQQQSLRMVGRIKSAGAIYSSAKRGFRDDLGQIFFRSRWEANYARFLNWKVQQQQIASWSYEVDTFWFEKIRRGVRSYTPDFKITGHDGTVWYEEIKGWMDAKSKTKLKRMAKYHPTIRVIVIGPPEYSTIEKTFSKMLPNWEYKGA
jgi:hypothetical protein